MGALLFLFHVVLVGHVLLLQTITGLPVEGRAANGTIPLRELDIDYVSLSRRQDTELRGGANYVADFGIGSSNTQITILVDTGSTDLVIDPSAIPDDGSVTSTGGSCAEAYGGNAAVGGDIYAGPYSFSQYSVSGQLCASARNNARFDGIMGLGFYRPAGGPSVSSQTGDSPLYEFNDAGLSSFAIYLSSQRQGGGAFTPNDYDQVYIYDNAPFATENVDVSAGFWQFGLANYQYDGNTYDLGVSSGFVDSGTPTIRVSSTAASNIWNLVGADPNDGSYSDCSVNGDPITIVAASGNTFDIPASIYVIRNPFAASPACICAFQPIKPNVNQNRAILGAPFMRAYYTYFDIDNQQMSFALSAG